MRHIITLILTVCLAFSALSQNNTCQTASPYVDNVLIVYTPSTNWVELYRRFVAPSSSVNFSYTPFSAAPNGTVLCPTIDVLYTLYDSNCGFVATSSDGSFNGLVPGVSYTVGFIATCTVAGGIGFVIIAEDTTLPVELLFFTAESIPSGVNVMWATASELNCAGFMIERSADTVNWLNIGYVEGAGYSQQTIRYVFEDRRPVNGVNYYRLTQYDLNGQFEMLQIIAIVWNKEVTTNPFRLYNFLGQKVVR